MTEDSFKRFRAELRGDHEERRKVEMLGHSYERTLQLEEEKNEAWKLVERQDEALAIERRRIEELEEALRPFNRLHRDTSNPGAYVQIKVLSADLMRVRAALAKEEGGEWAVDRVVITAEQDATYLMPDGSSVDLKKGESRVYPLAKEGGGE